MIIILKYSFAFVIQGEGVDALGTNGKGMGYSGINNSLAVEFDTYFDPEENDPYENHISIQTRGWRHSNSEDHLYSLGHTNNVPDLTDGTIRIRYVSTGVSNILPHNLSSHAMIKSF